MTEEWNPEHVEDILEREEIRRILALASEKAMSAEELADRLAVSESTVHRCINVCQQYDFLSEKTHINEEGNDYKMYETVLQRICIEIESGGFDVTIELRQNVVE